jgi:hypothetical protein
LHSTSRPPTKPRRAPLTPPTPTPRRRPTRGGTNCRTRPRP